MKINWGYANKAIVSLLGDVVLYLQEYPGVGWKQITIGLIGTALVWLVPNTSKSVPTQKAE